VRFECNYTADRMNREIANEYSSVFDNNNICNVRGKKG
jgi:hypothetical protein